MTSQKPYYKPKSDRYDKMNNTKLMLRESSWGSSSFDTTATINPESIPESKECRICLSTEDPTGSSELQSPCKCTGSVKYMHRHCFLQWMNKNFEHKKAEQKAKILKEGTQCEICKQKIPIIGIFQTKWGNFDEISFRVKLKPVLFTVFTLMEATCLGVLAFVIAMMLKMGLGFKGEDLVNSLIMICSLILVLILAFAVGYFYVNDYFVSEKFVISDFGKPGPNSNPQVAQEGQIQQNLEPSVINLEE